MAGRADAELEIEGRRLRLSNLGKVFYRATGFTKGQVVDYSVRVAPALLPHLRDRPLTLKRYPDGADGPFFYEKRCPAHRPPWVRTEPVWSEANDEHIRFCVVDDLATLVWAVNLADLEMHTYLHRVPDVDRPTMLVFDLDPGPPADAVQCCEVALLLRALLERVGLAAFPKTSGSKGVQVYVPLNVRTGYDATRAFALAVAELLERERPDLVVSSMKKAIRGGKVLVDWSQNNPHKTTVCAYSLRARERPTVSTPVRWGEVERAFAARDAGLLAFDAPAVLARVERHGDLFEPVLTLRQALPTADEIARGAARRLRGAARSEADGAAPPSARPGASRPATRPAEGAGADGRRQAAPGRRAPRKKGSPSPPGRTPTGGSRRRRGAPRRGGGSAYLSTE